MASASPATRHNTEPTSNFISQLAKEAKRVRSSRQVRPRCQSLGAACGDTEHNDTSASGVTCRTETCRLSNASVRTSARILCTVGIVGLCHQSSLRMDADEMAGHILSSEGIVVDTVLTAETEALTSAFLQPAPNAPSTL